MRTTRNEAKIIEKVGKGFELITKARNIRLHLKTTQLPTCFRAHNDSYYDGREIKILSLTKSDIDKDFAFVTLTTEEAREDILNNCLTYIFVHIKDKVIKDKKMRNPSELRISASLVANNFSQLGF